MEYYAYIDENNIVTQVITGMDHDDMSQGVDDWELFYSNLANQRCLRTCIDTVLGENVNGGEPFRGNFASVGFSYNEELDAFIAPKPFDSWTLNQNTFDWEAPTTRPSSSHLWSEEEQSWFLPN